MPTPRELVRRDTLLDGLAGPVNLVEIDRHVRSRSPSVSIRGCQNATVETIRSLVADGLAETGYLWQDGRFVPEPLERTMREIGIGYITHYDEPGRWMRCCWLRLTASGRQLATSTLESGPAPDTEGSDEPKQACSDDVCHRPSPAAGATATCG